MLGSNVSKFARHDDDDDDDDTFVAPAEDDVGLLLLVESVFPFINSSVASCLFLALDNGETDKQTTSNRGKNQKTSRRLVPKGAPKQSELLTRRSMLEYLETHNIS
jgi:hypothetical protein